MIELDNDSYIVGMWFSSDPVSNNDWMACVIRDPANPGLFKGWSRFRITKDAKIWDSEDEKKWTSFQSAPDNTEEDMIATMRGLQNAIQGGYPNKDKIIVKGGMEKLFRLSKDKDWLNLKQVKA